MFEVEEFLSEYFVRLMKSTNDLNNDQNYPVFLKEEIQHYIKQKTKFIVSYHLQELRRQCQKFAVDLLRQTRSSQELAIILNHDPDNLPYEDGEHMKLARLELAIHMKQKKVKKI